MSSAFVLFLNRFILVMQDLIGAGGAEAPKTVLEVIAHLANRLARWDDR
jgi:hypothetical protein